MSKQQTKVENLREKPSFENYASDWMASEEYALASLQERGLLFSLLNYCWANGGIPADPPRMALLLRLQEEDIASAMGNLVRKHFVPAPHDATRLYSSELERQRRIIHERRQRMSEGGKRGGQRTQEGVRAVKGAFSHPSSQAKAPEMKRNEMKRNAVFKEEQSSEHEEWIKEYEGATSYERQGDHETNGSG